MRYVLDTVIYNRAIEIPEFGLLLRDRCKAGSLDLVTTHVQEDQLTNTKDPIKRDALLAIFKETAAVETPTAAFVWDVSRWDEAEWPDDKNINFFNQSLLGTKPAHEGHANDALLAVTAFAKAHVFVTDDRKLQDRVREAALNFGGQLRVLSYEDFRMELEGLGKQ